MQTEDLEKIVIETGVSRPDCGKQAFLVVDKETGVNYIGLEIEEPRGVSVSITPRLNRAGKLFISE